MKKSLLLFFLLAAAFVSRAATLKTFEMDSKILNTKRTYVALFPDAYESDTNAFFPVLYTLHGLGDKPENWYKNIPMADIMEEMIKKGEIKPFVMVTVQAMGNDDKEGIGYFDQPGWKAQTFYFEEFIPQIEKQFRVSVLSSPNAMELWAMQYSGAVEVVSPLPLRERIKNRLADAGEKYKN